MRLDGEIGEFKAFQPALDMFRDFEFRIVFVYFAAIEIFTIDRAVA